MIAVAGIEGKTPLRTGTTTLDVGCKDVFVSKLEVFTSSVLRNRQAKVVQEAVDSRKHDMRNTVNRSPDCRELILDLRLFKRNVENVVEGKQP